MDLVAKNDAALLCIGTIIGSTDANGMDTLRVASFHQCGILTW